MRRQILALTLVLVVGITALASYLPQTPDRPLLPDVNAALLNARFQGIVRPFLQTYCLECHGDKMPEAGLNLGLYTTMAAVTRDYRRWNTLLGKLKRGEMPPEDADRHPTPAQTQPIIAWIQDAMDEDARRHAGDPGLVLAHRLSNAEYDYTIRDLTGQDIQPTREFPVDPSNEAGFDNSGESLAMSPELVKKYLDAAQQVADHIVFQPNGFTFAPFTVVTDEDRDKYAVGRVVDFYKKQGLSLTGTSGTYRWQSLDYADYFAAAWRFQNRTALGRPTASLEDFAKAANLSPKYLAKIWATLTSNRRKNRPHRRGAGAVARAAGTGGRQGTRFRQRRLRLHPRFNYGPPPAGEAGVWKSAQPARAEWGIHCRGFPDLCPLEGSAVRREPADLRRQCPFARHVGLCPDRSRSAHPGR